MKKSRLSIPDLLPELPEYLFLISPDFRILWTNKKAASLLEGPETLCFEAVHGRKEPPPGCPALKALTEGRPVQAIQKAERLQKDFYVSVVPIKEEDKITALWHLAVDVTSNQVTERDLSSYTYEIIGYLAAGLSHDLKNMLTAALGELQVLTLMAENQPHLKRRYQKLANILQEIVSFSQKLCSLGKTKSQPELLNLNEVLSELSNLMKALTPKRIQLQFIINPYVKRVYMNRAMLEQIILNLFLNALHAIPETGKITISTSQEENFAVLTIEDTGTGMKPDLVKCIFDPYFTTKEEGSGLGLALVKRWVEEAGGRIKVFTEEGLGSRFEVWLPTVDH
ncbi:MAG: GHKL domain-containing protein [Thermodesulfobacteria bacterium]|nr:GHKL domain-containing protein [Thermodesulfobacteriota bacterium]